MINNQKHQLIMGNILRDLYANSSIAPILGLKGGTCAYFFYGLPRFSVDLDFDLFKNDDSQEMIFKALPDILSAYGKIKDARVKRFTVFFLLSYGDSDHNIKVEINTRIQISHINDMYELREHLGISMMAAKKEYLFAGKLAALASRKRVAMRDIYDVWYFAKNNWDIDADALCAITGKSIKEHLKDCIAVIEQVKDNEILHGLGEPLDEKQKAWVKRNLRSEACFMLKNYLSVFG